MRCNTIYYDNHSPFETVVHELMHVYRELTGQSSVEQVNSMTEYIGDQVAAFLRALILENGQEIIRQLYTLQQKEIEECYTTDVSESRE